MVEAPDSEEQEELDKAGRRRVKAVRTSKVIKFNEYSDDQLPIVYSPEYNITCYGLEKLHPFDSCKWGRVMKELIEGGYITQSTYIRPTEVSHQDLRVVHSQHYLNSLLVSCVVAKCVEVPLVALIPYCIIERRLLKSMRLQTGGTITSAYLALEKGWAINIGGGFHHAHAYGGGGFCLYADITLALQFLFLEKKIKKAMIIDLDAHQGNGPEKDFAGNEDVYIMDMFNYEIYPRDFKAKESISLAVRLQSYTEDAQYLHKLNKALNKALEDFQADIVIYNAGTDCLDGDPVGHLSLSEKGTVTRDEMVFKKTTEAGLPIVMLLSGGYTQKSANVITASIKNLFDKQIIG